MQQNVKTSLGVAIIIIFAITVGFFTWKAMNIEDVKTNMPTVNEPAQNSPITGQPTGNQPSQVCTQEAKQCPDGSYVSRTGPNCEFATCPASNITISFSPNEVNNCEKNWKTPSVYRVSMNGKEIGNVQKEGCATRIRFIGKNSDFAYFEIQPVGIGGYIVTDLGYFDVYQINLSNNGIKKLGEGIAAFDKDFRKTIMVDVENRKITLKEISSGIEKNIKVPDKYSPGDNQLGDFYFSPNLQKIAMKFVYGEPGSENCEIYSFDVNSEALSLYKKINYLVQVTGWKDDSEISWKKME